MATRDKVLWAVIVVCALGVLYLVLGDPFGRKRGPGEGALRGIPVVCASCKHEESHFDASPRGDWPRKCPQCGQTALHLARKCEHCGRLTPDEPPVEGRDTVKCIHCGKIIWLVPPPVGTGP